MITGSNCQTIHLENGQKVYPCRCGETHRGDYACEDMLQHECFHNDTLVGLAKVKGKPMIYGVCPLCGCTFYMDLSTVTP